jgi:biotin carboxyl carrier protein
MKKYEYLINGSPFVVEILSFDGRRGEVRVNNITYSVEVPQGPAARPPAYVAPSAVAPPPAAVEPPRPPLPKAPEAPRASAPAAPPAPKKAPVPPPSSRPSSDSLVTAPMPGIILSVAVKEGDIVQAGDSLLVLEAMKMENEIHAPRAGTVKRIFVSAGAEVRAGSELIELA